MAIAMTLEQYLSDQGVEYDTVRHSHTFSSMDTAHAAHVPGDQLAKAVVLQDKEGYLLAVLPATHKLELGMLQNQLQRDMALAPERDVGELFKDCEFGAVPPVGSAYGVDTVCDDALMEAEQVFMEAGDHERLVRMSGANFRKLMARAAHGHFSYHI